MVAAGIERRWPMPFQCSNDSYPSSFTGSGNAAPARSSLLTRPSSLRGETGRLAAPAFDLRGQASNGVNSSRSTQPALYAAFLYGANIPGGRQVTERSVEAALQPLQPSVTFAGALARRDSILL